MLAALIDFFVAAPFALFFALKRDDDSNYEAAWYQSGENNEPRCGNWRCKGAVMVANRKHNTWVCPVCGREQLIQEDGSAGRVLTAREVADLDAPKPVERADEPAPGAGAVRAAHRFVKNFALLQPIVFAVALIATLLV